MTLRKKSEIVLIVFLAVLVACSAAPLNAQMQRPPSFLAQRYDVSATLDTIGQSISAVAKVDFRATEVSSNVRVELHPNLEVHDVKTADGKSLTFSRDSQNPLFVVVSLPTPVAS